MTKKMTVELKNILYHATRALRFLEQDGIAVARKGKVATTTLHYTRADGGTLYEIDKEIGSDLTGLKYAIEGLDLLLATH